MTVVQTIKVLPNLAVNRITFTLIVSAAGYFKTLMPLAESGQYPPLDSCSVGPDKCRPMLSRSRPCYIANLRYITLFAREVSMSIFREKPAFYYTAVGLLVIY